MIFGKHINRYYWRYLHMFILGLVALIAVDYFQLIVPEVVGSIVDHLDNNTLTVELLKDFLKKMILVIVVMFAGRALWRIAIFGTSVNISCDMRKKMFDHSVNLPQEYYSHHKTGALMAYYTNDLQALQNSFGMGMVMLIDIIFLGGITAYKMIKLNPFLTIISILPLFVFAIMGSIIGKYMQKKFEARQKAFEELSDFTQENFSGFSVIKAFVKEAIELTRFNRINKDNEQKNLEFIKYSIWLNILITVFVNLVALVIVCLGGYYVYQNKMKGIGDFSVGNLTTFIAYFSTLTWPMMALAQLINLRGQAKASLKRISTMLDEKSNIIDNKMYKNVDFRGKITFNNVSFAYPNTEEQVLKNVSFTIEAGQFIGIIGRTGSSKTTLVDLLLRIYNVDSNSIFIDDLDIMDISINKTRSLIGYVPQENFLFSDTITNNIAFSDEFPNDDEVKEAAVLAEVDQNIEDFPNKYDTVLGERGVTLSGGQKQRVSIARALYKEPLILILDDSLSAVDTKTEEKILDNLLKVRKNKTTIFIAHRISTIKDADKIIVLEDGVVTGVGSHDELEKTNSIYHELVRLQKLEDLEGGEYDG